jgi:hypothetical protein
VVFALAHLLLRRLVGLTANSSSELLDTEVELLVLRHQLKVRKRQVGHPRLRRRDRLFMAAISRVLPRARWSRSWSAPKRSFGGTGSWCDGMDLPSEISRRQATDPRRGSRPHPPDGEGAPRWGCIRIRGELAKLHCRDRLASDAPRVVRHPHRDASGDDPRSDQEPGLGVGHSASPQPRGRGAASRGPLRAPRPGLEALRPLRRGASLRGREDHQGSSRLLYGLRGRTLTPGGGSAPSGRSAWTGCSFSAAATGSGC